MLCGAQSPRRSSHLIRAKYYLFASFWRINHLFAVDYFAHNDYLYLKIPIGDVQWISRMHSSSDPKLFVACNGCDHNNSTSWAVHIKSHASGIAGLRLVMF